MYAVKEERREGSVGAECKRLDDEMDRGLIFSVRNLCECESESPRVSKISLFVLCFNPCICVCVCVFYGVPRYVSF